MAIIKSPIANNFADYVFNFILEGEGSEAEIYLDTKNIPTIGYGFALAFPTTGGLVVRSDLGGALTQAGISWSSAQFNFLNGIVADINAGNTSLAKQNLIDAYQTGGIFDGGEISTLQSKGLFDFALQSNLDVVRNKPSIGAAFQSFEASHADSNELAALYSMIYNNPSLFGAGLADALQSGDRARAWYEMLYNHEDYGVLGLMNRREHEANEFGLTNDNANAEEIALELNTLFNGTDKGGNNIYNRIQARDQHKPFESQISDALQDVEAQYTNNEDIDFIQVADGNWITGGTISAKSAAGKNEATTKNLIIGSEQVDTIEGKGGNDFLYGKGGADNLVGGDGDDYIDGGDDIDTAVFSGNFADYKFTKVSDTEWTVEHRNNGADGTDTLIDIEKAQFADKTVSLTGGTDLAIAIDISGSMGDDIAAVQSSSQAVLDAIFNGDNGSVDNRVGILTFNDTGDISGITNFTDQAGIDDRKAAAASGISSVMLSNGGQEPLNGALLYALEGGLGAWREEADTRRIVVFSDEPPADPELASQVQQAALNPAVGISSSALLYSSSAMSVTQTLTATSGGYVEIFTVAIGNDPAAIAALAQIAAENNGQAFLAADASELVAALVEAISAPPSEPEPELILIEGTNGYDLLYGGDDAEEIFAYDGNDDVYAGKGDDILHGGNGHDLLVGDEGDDLIHGDAGDDELYGAEGNDTLEGGSGYDILAGEDGDDSLSGGTQEDELFGEAGNDTLDGGAHADYLEGGSGDDSLIGGDGADELYGQADNDTLDGGAGDDDLYGGGGNDILISDIGDDYLEGGAGSDTFRFESIADSSMADGIDYIGDFTQGADKIDLSGLGFADLSDFQVYNDGSYTEVYDNATGFALGFDGDYDLQNSDFIF